MADGTTRRNDGNAELPIRNDGPRSTTAADPARFLNPTDPAADRTYRIPNRNGRRARNAAATTTTATESSPISATVPDDEGLWKSANEQHV